MKKLLRLFLTFSVFSFSVFLIQNLQAEPEQSSNIDLSEPPFWMFSYDEFKDLQQDQKSFYLSHIETELKTVPSLKDVTKAGLSEASQWHEGWNIIQRKFYRACQEKDHQKTCERMENLRLQALEMHSNQKKENRQASK